MICYYTALTQLKLINVQYLFLLVNIVDTLLCGKLFFNLLTTLTVQVMSIIMIIYDTNKHSLNVTSHETFSLFSFHHFNVIYDSITKRVQHTLIINDYNTNSPMTIQIVL